MRGFMPYHNENSWTGLELVLVFSIVHITRHIIQAHRL
jgi:hypothetical protein